MLEIIFLLVLGLAWIVFATAQDIKEREVANWGNFALIIFALGFRFFWSLFSTSGNGFGFFYQGLIGLGIFFILGNLFYYTRLFAGGDAKLMIALGAVLPLSGVFVENVQIYIWFLGAFLFSGAIYGFIWSLVLVFRNAKIFSKEFSGRLRKSRMWVSPVLLFALFVAAFGLLYSNTTMFLFGILIFVSPYIYLYAKSVDEACMIKKVRVNALREGDWLTKDLKISRGKVVRATWNGLSKKDIALIKRREKFVYIRQGIPFVPVFLISFLFLSFLTLKEFFLGV